MSPKYIAILIFLLTYIIITGRRLNILKIGRPGGVMLGVLLLIIFKVITPAQTIILVNWDTILLLLGMMIIIEHLSEAGFFNVLAAKIDSYNLSDKNLLAVVVFVFGGLAAFLVNDVVCIFMTPLLIIMIKQRNLNPLPFLLALATATNLGGAITFTGNPQNMIVGTLSKLSYSKYFLLMLPIGIITLIINYIILLKLFKNISAEKKQNLSNISKTAKKPLFKRSIFAIILVIILFFAEFNMPWSAIAGATFLIVLAHRDEIEILRKIDWNLLLFFSGLFVVIGALKETGATDYIINYARLYLKGSTFKQFWIFGILTLFGSNIFANVPYVLVSAEWIKELSNPDLMWYVLAFGSTVAGNLTIIGAIANIIVIEKARDICEITFWDYFKFGFPSTIVNFIVGMNILWLYHIIGLL